MLCTYSCSLTPVVSKASSGVMELMPIHSIMNTTEFCQVLKESKWDVVGTGSKTDESNGTACKPTPVGSFQLSNPTLIILGKIPCYYTM
jgi:tRNA G18 (ribose-2'-O)-methylase SpoU